ncbi:MAG: hypothetical protein D6808_06560, partial [Candidatus Dadabacteria bacterium]
MENRSEHDAIPPLKKVLKGAGLFLLGTFLSRFITYFTRIFIARYFGPEEYGLFSLGLAVVGFAAPFAALGLPIAIKRYVPYYRAKMEEARVKGVMLFSFLAVALASAITGGVLFLLSSQMATTVFHNPELKDVFKVFAMSIPFASLSSLLASSFEGFQDIKYRVYTERILSNVFKLVFIILFGVLGYGLLGIAFAYTIATALTFSSTIIIMKLLSDKLALEKL